MTSPTDTIWHNHTDSEDLSALALHRLALSQPLEVGGWKAKEGQLLFDIKIHPFLPLPVDPTLTKDMFSFTPNLI